MAGGIEVARNVVHDHRRKAANGVVALADADPVDDDRPSQGRGRGCDWLDEMIRALPGG
jgi:hypothetical protein